MELELREITPEVLDELRTHVVLPPHQARWVGGTVDDTLQEAAQVPEANPWYRGVYDEGEPVGFVMIAWDVPPIEGLIGPWFLWKLAIDRDHQGRGYGHAVVDAIVEIVRANGGTELYTSYVDEPGGPGPFYARLGFVPAGDHDGEVLVVKPL
jgi:GNAT superfamily N-acetyltransferase